MAMVTNACEIVGRLNRLDLREGVAKTGSEFVSATYTLAVGDNLIKVETFTMKTTKNGDDSKGYQALMTIFFEAKALHKTYRKVGASESEVMTDGLLLEMLDETNKFAIIRENLKKEHPQTIVEDIDECDAIVFSNYGNFKYCRLEENAYVKDGELIRTMRITGAFPNRLDESKKEYVPRADFEIVGKVMKNPIMMEVDEQDVMQLKVMFPIYQEAYGDRPAKVTLNEITLQARDSEAFEYIEDNFTKGTMVSLNGEIVRLVTRVEIEGVADDSRGFGRKVEHKTQYRTNVEEYFNLLGGYELEEEEIELEKALDMELWEVAYEEREKQGEVQEEPKKSKVGFGREDKKVTPKKGGSLPF